MSNVTVARRDESRRGKQRDRKRCSDDVCRLSLRVLVNPEGLSSPDFKFDFLLMIYVGISHMAGTPRPGGNCSPL